MCRSIIKDQRAGLQLPWNSAFLQPVDSLVNLSYVTSWPPHHSSICISCQRQDCLSFSSKSHCKNSNNSLNSTEKVSLLPSYKCPLLSAEKLGYQCIGQLLLHHSVNHFIPCINRKVLAVCSRGTCPERKPQQQKSSKRPFSTFYVVFHSGDQ